MSHIHQFGKEWRHKLALLKQHGRVTFFWHPMTGPVIGLSRPEGGGFSVGGKTWQGALENAVRIVEEDWALG